MRITKICFFSSVLFVVNVIIGCKTNHYDDETRIFNQYLQENYNKRIQDEVHYYFIANSFVCKGCIQKYLYLLNEYLIDDRKRNDVSLITTLNYDILKVLDTKVSLLIDKNKNIDYENLNLHDFNLIITRKKEIQDIISYTIEQELSYKEKLKEIFEK